MEKILKKKKILEKLIKKKTNTLLSNLSNIF